MAIVIVGLPSAFPLLLRMLWGRGGPITSSTLLHSITWTKLVLPLGAQFAPGYSVRKDIGLESRSRNTISTDDAGGGGERAMALKEALEPDTRLYVINILGVVAKKLNTE